MNRRSAQLRFRFAFLTGRRFVASLLLPSVASLESASCAGMTVTRRTLSCQARRSLGHLNRVRKATDACHYCAETCKDNDFCKCGRIDLSAELERSGAFFGAFTSARDQKVAGKLMQKEIMNSLMKKQMHEQVDREFPQAMEASERGAASSDAAGSSGAAGSTDFVISLDE